MNSPLKLHIHIDNKKVTNIWHNKTILYTSPTYRNIYLIKQGLTRVRVVEKYPCTPYGIVQVVRTVLINHE